MTTTLPNTTSDKVLELRAELPATSATVYLNAGTNGPLPRVTADELRRTFDYEFEHGRIGPTHYQDLFAGLDELRAVMSSIFNAETTEVALTRSTTDGLNIAFWGLEWQPGDEIITTNMEHICLFSVLSILAYRKGVTIKTIDLGHGGGDVLAAIETATTSKTRAIAISHVQWSSGAVMPLKEIAAFARSRDIITIVDGAQSAGQIAIDFHDLGIDAYAIAGQKWLCGPVGSGALFVRNDRISQIRPTYLRFGAFDQTGFVIPPAGAKRYELGEPFEPAINGQRVGLAWLRDDVGFPWLTERVAELGSYGFDLLSNVPNVSVTTPLHVMAGIICFNVEGKHPKEVSDQLYERGYTIRYVDNPPAPSCARVSTGWWNTQEEIEGLVDEIRSIAAP